MIPRTARPTRPQHAAGIELQLWYDPNTCLGTPEAPVYPADPWATPTLQRYLTESLCIFNRLSHDPHAPVFQTQRSLKPLQERNTGCPEDRGGSLEAFGSQGCHAQQRPGASKTLSAPWGTEAKPCQVEGEAWPQQSQERVYPVVAFRHRMPGLGLEDPGQAENFTGGRAGEVSGTYSSHSGISTWSQR